MSIPDGALRITETKDINCQCHTKVHFTSQNICIQDLQPAHYDGSHPSSEKEALSPFVMSILGSSRTSPPKDEGGESSPPASGKSLLDELRAGLAVGEFAQAGEPVVNSHPK